MIPSFFTQLAKELLKDLPGEEFQYRMASAYRNSKTTSTPPNNGCVLIVLYYSENHLTTALIKRAVDMYIHSGQISLPGGRCEESDTSPAHTALREAEEEINVNPKRVHLLGSLTSIYIPASHFQVHPVVGYVNERPDFRPNPREVQEIIEVPLRDLFDPEKIGSITITRNTTTFEAPCFNTQNHQVWGATAMILSEFLEVVKRAGFSDP